MCGRFARRDPDPAPFPEFSRHWPQLPPRYNIAPSEEVLVLRVVDGEARAELARWGLRPRWLREPAKPQINARAETAAVKPFFREAFARTRCLLVADGWYEWRAEAGVKQPYFFHFADDRSFTLGGLWTAWSDAAGDHATCAILTTRPNALAARVHDRMPVLVEMAERLRWLDPATPRELIEANCASYPGGDLVVHPVSTRVNAPRHDDPECVAPVGRPL